MQVALALLDNIAIDPTFEVICVVNSEIDSQLSTLAKGKIKHYFIELYRSKIFIFFG